MLTSFLSRSRMALRRHAVDGSTLCTDQYRFPAGYSNMHERRGDSICALRNGCAARRPNA